jgi:two-component system, OmpR family, phosphate regulon sensor histidine kinase PhoR
MFWKLLLGQTIVLALVAMQLLYWGWPNAVSSSIALEKDSLRATADSLAKHLSTHHPNDSLPAGSLARFAYPDDKVQVFDEKGKPLYPPDSSEPTDDIARLIVGNSTTRSTLLEVGKLNEEGHSLRLIDRSSSPEGPARTLLLTRSLARADRQAEQRRRESLTLLGIVWCALAGITFALTRQWSRQLRTIHEDLSSLLDGSARRPRLPSSYVGDDFDRLARVVRDVQTSVAERVDGIDQVRKDLQTMLESIPEAVLAIDADQRVLFANASTYRLFGLPAEDIAGKKLWAILRQPGLQDAVSMTLASKEPTSTEFAIRRPPRVVRYFGRSLAVGSGRGIIIVLHDITELRRLERLRQDFFASVSHELKTPLAAIKAYTETLLDDEQQDRSVTRRFLLRVEEQADRLHSLVIDMLMLARVESEDHGFDVKPIDARPAIVNSVDYFREKGEAKRVLIESRLLPDPCIVMADSEGLGMIIRNLVDNAVKYTPAGGQVTVTTSSENGDLVVDVADTGVGIPVEDLNRIFERFYRVDKARSRELGGTGLGLSIVKHLVQRFGGTVSVKSRLNEGSTFTVSLPLAVGRFPSKQGQGLVEQETNA